MPQTSLFVLFLTFSDLTRILPKVKDLDTCVKVTFQQLPQVHWGFYQPLNWAKLAWVRRKTHSVVWGLLEQRGTTDDNFKQLYSHISHHSHMDFNTTPLHKTHDFT